MPLETLLKLLSAAKFSIAVGVFGLVLHVGGSNAFLKNTGLNIALLATGTAAATATRKDDRLREIQTLETRHAAQMKALKASSDTAMEDAATARQMAQKHQATAQHTKGMLAQLETAMKAANDECERLRAEAIELSTQLNSASTALGTCHTDNSTLAGDLAALNEERMALIYELYETAVTEANLSDTITGLESQFQGDVNYQVGQKKKLKSQLTKARAGFHTEIAEAETRIEGLEAQLKEKTELAQQMLGELEGDANGAFTQLGGKANAQDAMIQSLRAQLDEARKTTKALTHRRFDTVGTDNTIGNRLIDALAKSGSIYGAFHNEREGNNGRLKIWLTLIDAPLKRAQDALEDIEAELSLWAKPSVKVDRGMHLFTLATEQEHKVLAAPNVPLTRLEKTLDTAMHARIVGGSGSGKTVLLNNLMHYMAASMEGANVTLLDPKAVDDWGHFIPKYWGEECVTGIVELADGLKWRVADTVQHRKAGKPAPSYDPELFILDEAQYNYLLAQNADDSSTETGKNAPKYAKKAKGALAGLLSLGRAYDAVGLFVTQLPQVSKVGLNEGSFDPCVNIFLGAQIDNAIDKFLPGSGFTDSQCKRLTKEAATRRQLGQKWLMLVADLPRSEAYLMECPAPGYYHNRFSGDLGHSPKTVKIGKNLQSIDKTDLQTGSELGGPATLPTDSQPSPSPLPTSPKPSAHCPKCSHKSIKTHGKTPAKNGKFRFICENDECAQKTFRAHPLA